MDTFTVFYTGPFRYPDQDAAGKRVDQVVKIIEGLEECKHITVGGWESGVLQEKVVSKKTRKVSFSLLGKHKKTKLLRLVNHLFMGGRVIKWMITNRNKISLIILYNPPFVFALLSLLYAFFYKKKIALDSTEWYQSEHLPGGRFGLASIENWSRMRIAYPLFKNVIVISDYLNDYFNNLGRNIIKIPPLAEKYNGSPKSINTNAINFFYAGSPGKKDKLAGFVNKLISIDTTMYPGVKFYIAGLTLDDFHLLYPTFVNRKEELNKICIFLGRITMTEVYSWYGKINFCVFFRDKKRYSLAGFPSKYVEALSYGIPVVSNSIGDISLELPYIGYIFDPEKDNIKILLNELCDLSVYRNKCLNIESVFNKKYCSTANTLNVQHFIRKIK
ncbi:glycosyltransferase [Buttiauxella ferragutiae]|uniref:glycosyltransferase n=1 Tax=Buttiauxella ferragutiae TaxID=82989 RepID=UPI001F53ABB8|nr:glycosyltransferase [Buttiauxella ferragutiae]UNK62853.1 glycosyltransferase [Buttiauxella ferragutiae]